MDSEVIKKIVIKVNSLCDLGDLAFTTPESRELGALILYDIRRGCKRSQTFAVAITQYMLDHGFDLKRIGDQEYAEFMTQFGGKLENLSETQLAVVRNISGNLFSQATKAP